MVKLKSLKNRLPTSMKEQVGASAIEYAVIAGLIVMALAAAFEILGPGLATTMQAVVDTMTGATGEG